MKAKGLPWEIAKSFDGAAVIAPFVVGSTFPDLTSIGIRLTINGQVRQDGISSDMLNPIVPVFFVAGRRCDPDRYAGWRRPVECR